MSEARSLSASALGSATPVHRMLLTISIRTRTEQQLNDE